MPKRNEILSKEEGDKILSNLFKQCSRDFGFAQRVEKESGAIDYSIVIDGDYILKGKGKEKLYCNFWDDAIGVHGFLDLDFKNGSYPEYGHRKLKIPFCGVYYIRNSQYRHMMDVMLSELVAGKELEVWSLGGHEVWRDEGKEALLEMMKHGWIVYTTDFALPSIDTALRTARRDRKIIDQYVHKDCRMCIGKGSFVSDGIQYQDSPEIDWLHFGTI